MRLIDADAFKKVLSAHEMQYDKRRSFDDYACGAANAYEYAGDLLDEMPTVDRPHGEWIFHKYDKNYECSNCHVRLDKTQIYTEKRFENALWAKMEIYKFCPNCGASMIKKEGEAE